MVPTSRYSAASAWGAQYVAPDLFMSPVDRIMEGTGGAWLAPLSELRPSLISLVHRLQVLVFALAYARRGYLLSVVKSAGPRPKFRLLHVDDHRYLSKLQGKCWSRRHLLHSLAFILFYCNCADSRLILNIQTNMLVCIRRYIPSN